MLKRETLRGLICGFTLVVNMAAQTARPGYDIAYIGPPMADPILQHAKETYVLYGCSYCHGLYLNARGEATDLMHSKLVGRDKDGSLIKALLRTGIPQTAKLSPMPQFSDLSDTQLGDIARWIHYSRQQGRYKELMESKDPAGNAEAGKAYFEQSCASCHSSVGDLTKKTISKAEILRPKFVTEPVSWKADQQDAKMDKARREHSWLLENYSAEDVANVLSYLKTAK